MEVCSIPSTCPWTVTTVFGILRGIRKIDRQIFLSGGLDAKNVREAIRMVHPDWVDVSSSVEKVPGKKDPAKIKEFIQAVKGLTENRI
ncbi:MAG: hypothetical protein NC908_04235 [Candidatus Omnitrophica bacterium]|nr:hypothetical protein [Candidatus Omnitrophota bacterium]